MRGTRILRYVGNRTEPERELFGQEEEIRSLVQYPVIDLKALRKSVDLLTGGYELSGLGGVYIKHDPYPDTMYSYLTSAGIWNMGVDFGYDQVEPQPKPAEVDFEVNLVEPLVGWKKWTIDGKFLVSMFGCEWKHMQAMEAACTDKCSKIPAEHHSCGFYAVDHRIDIPNDNDDDEEIIGQVYGWGRYIRGDKGWRAQFAYPKSFYLRTDQEQHVEHLKRYGVPIYLYQPIPVYFPEEDSYEHRQDDENGGIGTIEDSCSTESEDSDDET